MFNFKKNETGKVAHADVYGCIKFEFNENLRKIILSGDGIKSRCFDVLYYLSF